MWMNGGEWLGGQVSRAGIGFVAAGNCFPWVEEWKQAQSLLAQQLRTDWPALLGSIARDLNPIHEQIFSKHPMDYYWSTHQSEWAIDVVFREAAALRRLYPRLVHHGMTSFGSGDVMRYLGKRVRLAGRGLRNLSGHARNPPKNPPQAT